ncbi:hypothetical protein WA158_007950 [Blastocystis sp. Blastoise]
MLKLVSIIYGNDQRSLYINTNYDYNWLLKQIRKLFQLSDRCVVNFDINNWTKLSQNLENCDFTIRIKPYIFVDKTIAVKITFDESSFFVDLPESTSFLSVIQLFKSKMESIIHYEFVDFIVEFNSEEVFDLERRLCFYKMKNGDEIKLIRKNSFIELSSLHSPDHQAFCCVSVEDIFLYTSTNERINSQKSLSDYYISFQHPCICCFKLFLLSPQNKMMSLHITSYSATLQNIVTTLQDKQDNNQILFVSSNRTVLQSNIYLFSLTSFRNLAYHPILTKNIKICKALQSYVSDYPHCLSFKKGALFEITSTTNNWYYCKYNGTQGYVPIDYVHVY